MTNSRTPQFNRVALACAVALLSLSAYSQAPQCVIVPNAAQTTDYAFGSGILRNPNHRVQQIVAPSQFGTGVIAITAIRFRPDFFYGNAFTTTVSSIQFNLSTTTRNPDGLSPTYAENVGADDTVVFSGPLTISSQFSGPTNGPKAFDIVVPLSQTFVYNPAQGNLLLDVRDSSGSTASLVSGSGLNGDAVSRVEGRLDLSAGVADTGAASLQLCYFPTNAPAQNRPPIATSQTVSTAQNTSIAITLGANDPDGDALGFTFTRPSHGRLTGIAPNLIYTPLNGFAGSDSFTFKVSDGLLESAPATISIIVVGTTRPTDDLSLDFSLSSNPNGPWSYGWKSDLSGAFSLLTVPVMPPALNGVVLWSWQLGPGQYPAVVYNPTTNTATSDGGSGVFPPGTVFFFPGQEGTPQNFGVIRFTVPGGQAGTYQLSAVVHPYLNSGSGDTDFHVLKNGTELFGQFLSGTAPPTGYTNQLTLSAGDVIDFAIGRGTDGQLYASGLKIEASLDLLSSASVAPSILSQPHSQAAVAGDNVSFSVVADGTAPLTYRWFHGGTGINGATNTTLALTNVQMTAVGDYWVVIANSFGSITSSTVRLTLIQQGAASVAYLVPAGTIGNQFLPATEPQSLGMDFNVNSPITISSIGVFDSGSDGLRSPLTAHIYDRDTRVSLVQLTFTPQSPGTLIGGSRFLALPAPLRLEAGFHAC